MTARLPIIGSDDGTWGSILNTFLDVSHNADGSLIPQALIDAGSVQSINSNKPDNTGNVTIVASDIGALTESEADALYVEGSGVGQPNGVASLDGTGSVPLAQLSNAPSAPVSTVFTRTGAITAQTGDYTAAQVTNAADKSSSSSQNFMSTITAPQFSINTAGTTGFVMTDAPSSGNTFIASAVSGDTQDRFVIYTNGAANWGPGGSTTQDTRLYRSNINSLTIDNGSGGAGNLTVTGNATIADSLNLGSDGTPIGQLYVGGALPTSVVGQTATGSSPTSVVVQANYAYVTVYNTNTLQVIDVSDPTSPAVVGSVTTSNYPSSVVVQGRYAYVIDLSPGVLQVIDVSDPTSPAVVGSITFSGDSAPYAAVVSGRYAYVNLKDYNTYQFQVVDISDPTSPAVVGSVTTGSSPGPIDILGSYAYIGTTSSLQVVDIANPVSPSIAGNLSLSYALDAIAVSGRYAYIVSANTHTFQVVDISDPAGPIALGSATTAFGPKAITISGRYAYIAVGSGTFQVVDISDPTSPTVIGSGPSGANQYSLTVSGRYVYLVGSTSNALQIFDIGGSYIQQLEAGGAEFGGLSVVGDASIAGNTSLAGGLSVGQSIQVDGDAGVGGKISALDLSAYGLSGATATSRYVGATASGAPASGSFNTGDFIVDQSGAIWVCSAGGSPGTWTKVGGTTIIQTGIEQTITSANTWQTIVTLTPTTTGMYTVSAVFEVASGTPTCGVQVTFADANGAQTVSVASIGTALSTGQWSSLMTQIVAHSGTAIDVQVQTSTTSNITASAKIMTG